ncbi:MAG: hypothetical protein H0W67_07370 [Gemmatimonadales bacterium]|nr:hypothetical protein [Gemmatimonadales bacterium]
MSPARRYLLGLAVTAVGATMVTLLSSPDIRTSVGWGAATGLVLQGPLGWWVVQSIGTERFLMTWGLGMLVRFSAVAIAGLIVVPAARWQAGPMLGAMIGVLVALLAVEGVTAFKAQARD